MSSHRWHSPILPVNQGVHHWAIPGKQRLTGIFQILAGHRWQLAIVINWSWTWKVMNGYCHNIGWRGVPRKKGVSFPKRSPLGCMELGRYLAMAPQKRLGFPTKVITLASNDNDHKGKWMTSKPGRYIIYRIPSQARIICWVKPLRTKPSDWFASLKQPNPFRVGA